LKKNFFIGLSAVLLVGLSGYLGYELHELSNTHTALVQDHKKLNNRAELLQKKYAEQKARATTLQRAKLKAEGFQRQAEMKVEEIKQKMAAQAVDIFFLQQFSSVV
jgi:N-acetyl-gamma-glutamylphosphate reductase